MRSRPSGPQSSNLPAHFVDSLRVLFDILDTQRTGLVPFEQICGRWQSLPKANLPPSFLECLRRVTPPNGLLSFERFMAGFRLALFDRQNAGRLHRVRSEGKLNEAGLKPPAMGINGLLVEGPRKSGRKGDQSQNVLHPPQHHVYASALRAMNASQPSLPTYHREESPPNVPLLRLPEPPTHTHAAAALLRRPASAGAPRVAAVPPNVSVDRNDNYGVIMRSKKSSTPQTAHSNTSTNSSGSGGGHPSIIPPPSIKTKRAPLPPTLRAAEGQMANYAVVNKHLNAHQRQTNGDSPPVAMTTTGQRFRPLSMTSSGSGSCSSGMGDIRWRDSGRMSASNSPPDSLRHYAEELQPQVAKHERLLEEETEVIERGMEITRNLLRWYEERVESLQKRRRMLSKGMVALDSAVHEQKLNFHRAQITELNRRMTALMSTTKRGFPTHENMHVLNGINGRGGQSNGHSASSPPTIRNAVPPPVHNGRYMMSNGGGSAGDYQEIHPLRHHQPPPQLTPQYLLKQNQKLAEELDSKSQLIDRLQREKRLADTNGHLPKGIHEAAGKIRQPAACIRSAIPNYAHLPIKIHDTLL